jgi:hypothetical protein
VDALHPAAAVVEQVLAQPDQIAKLLDLGGRDPALGQPPLLQELAQVPGVLAVGLGPLLASP